RWHLGRAVAVRDETGAITNWIGTNTDIHEQKRQSQNQKFLLEAAKELSKSLDYQETLDTVVKLSVPAIADWCSVDLMNDEGRFEQVALAHVDSSKLEAAKVFLERNPAYADNHLVGIAKVAKTGKPEFHPLVDN